MGKRKPAESTLPEIVTLPDGSKAQSSGIFVRHIPEPKPEPDIPLKLLKCLFKYKNDPDPTRAFREYYAKMTKAERKAYDAEQEAMIASLSKVNDAPRETIAAAVQLAKQVLANHLFTCDGPMPDFEWADGTKSCIPDPHDGSVPLPVRDACEILGLLHGLHLDPPNTGSVLRAFQAGMCVQRLLVRPFERHVKHVKNKTKVLRDNSLGARFSDETKAAALSRYDALLADGKQKKSARPIIDTEFGVADSTLRAWLTERKQNQKKLLLAR